MRSCPARHSRMYVLLRLGLGLSLILKPRLSMILKPRLILILTTDMKLSI